MAPYWYFVPSASGFAWNVTSTDPILWLDASESATIEESSNYVSEWKHKLNSSVSCAQSTGSSQPLLGSDANGNYIDFDSSDFLETTDLNSLLGDDDCTIIIVGQDGVPNNDVGYYFEGLNSSDEAVLALYWHDSWQQLIGRHNTALGTYAWGWHNNTSLISRALKRDGSTVYTYQNNAQKNTADATNVTLSNVKIGRKIGKLREVLVFDSALSASDRSDIETYLQDKWSYS